VEQKESVMTIVVVIIIIINGQNDFGAGFVGENYFTYPELQIKRACIQYNLQQSGGCSSG